MVTRVEYVNRPTYRRDVTHSMLGLHTVTTKITHNFEIPKIKFLTVPQTSALPW